MLSKSTQQKIVRALSRDPRLHNRAYEMRAVIDGTVIYSCASDRESCRDIFFEKIVEKILHVNETTQQRPQGKSKRGWVFTDFAQEWFEQIHAKKVISDTYSHDLAIYQKHIVPFFTHRDLAGITTADCMRYGMNMKEKGIGRTAEQCDQILRQIFDYAEAENLIKKNPMEKLKRVKSERENGVPLTKSEERAFVESIRGSRHEAVFLLILYCGLRPCEVTSAQIDGSFVVSQNRKQKDGKIVFKKIPITPMLSKHLDVIMNALPILSSLVKSITYINDLFHKHCKGHRLYDLRTTFATRAQECEVPETVVQAWMGHSAKTLLGRVYTKFSDDYLLKEGMKVNY